MQAVAGVQEQGRAADIAQQMRQAAGDHTRCTCTRNDDMPAAVHQQVNCLQKSRRR